MLDKQVESSSATTADTTGKETSLLCASLRSFRVLRGSSKSKSHAPADGRTSASLTGSDPRTTATVSVDEDLTFKHLHQFERSRRWSMFSSGLRSHIGRSQKPALVMYSISFYPWKMEAHGYYSHPEAAAEWVPDTASNRCQICLSAFHFTRRRHHCRLCGHLVCNDCSMQRTFFPFAKQSRNAHHLIKDGAPQRTCNACASTLKNMAAQRDVRVKQFTLRGDHASFASMPDRSSVFDDDNNGFQSQEATPELQLGRPSARYSERASQSARCEELEEVLRARTHSRSRSTTRHFVISSEWLEQWLSYVHSDDSLAASGISAGRSSVAGRRKTRCQRPGPISNYSLLNFANGKLVPMEDLERSRGNGGGGDYRVISQDVWRVFHRMYGGGPSIELLEVPATDDCQLAGSMVSRKQRSIMESTFIGNASVAEWVITEQDETLASLEWPLGEPRNKFLRQTATLGSLHQYGRRNNSGYGANQLALRATTSCAVRNQDERRRSSAKSSATEPRSLPISPQRSSHRESHSSSWRRWQQSEKSSEGSGVFSQVNVGTVLYDPNDLGSHSSDRTSSTNDRDRRQGSTSSGHHNPSQRGSVATAARAAAQAHKTSAMSLSRHSSILSDRATNRPKSTRM